MARNMPLRYTIFIFMLFINPLIAIIMAIFGFLRQTKEQKEDEAPCLHIYVLDEETIYIQEYDVNINIDKDIQKLFNIIKCENFQTRKNTVNCLYNDLLHAKYDKEYNDIMKKIERLN